jgi:hypothetical protein
MNDQGIEIDEGELAAFASGSQARSEAVRGVVDATDSVRLNQSVLGLIGAFFVEDAGSTLSDVVTKIKASETDLGDDGDKAKAMLANVNAANQAAVDNLTRTDIP